MHVKKCGGKRPFNGHYDVHIDIRPAAELTIIRPRSLPASNHSLPRPAMHVLIFKTPFYSAALAPQMIIHVHLTLKQPLINCGTLGHTLGQIMSL